MESGVLALQTAFRPKPRRGQVRRSAAFCVRDLWPAVQGRPLDRALLLIHLPQSGSSECGMSELLTQREPGPVAVAKGLERLIVGLNARDPGRRWRIASPPDRLEGAGAVRSGHVDVSRVVGPDDEHTIRDGSAGRSPANEDVSNHPGEEVA
jgi:hypothetical protein